MPMTLFYQNTMLSHKGGAYGELCKMKITCLVEAYRALEWHGRLLGVVVLASHEYFADLSKLRHGNVLLMRIAKRNG